MSAGPQQVREATGVDAATLDARVFGSPEPLVLRGLVADWPVVRAAAGSPAAGLAYLRGFYNGATVGAWFGPSAIRGRFFYNEDLSGYNYQASMVKLDVVLDALERHRDDAEPPAVYVGSTTIDACLPGFRAANDVAGVPTDALASIWIGNRTRIAAHHDLPDNLACIAVGRRRFTLFAPEELPNLYAGPLEFTPAGQQVSMVDFAAPDAARHPRFAAALARARVAELGPGDALFIPGMWWHHVEALDAANVLVNYWWRTTPAYMDAPAGALMHALLAVRGLPPRQRAAWRAIFDHYVFGDGDGEGAVAHLPRGRQGVLGPIDEDRARSLRAMLLRQLKR